MTRYVLTTGPDVVDATGASNVIVAAGNTLSAGDVIVAAPYSQTALILQDGNGFDLSAPAVLRGVGDVQDRSVGDSVITLRAGLDLTLHLGRDNATVYGAANADRIVGGQGGYATIHLGGPRESVVAGPSGASVYMTAADAGARIDGRGVTTLYLTGPAGSALVLDAAVQGVGEAQIEAPGMHLVLRDAGIAAVALFGRQCFVALDPQAKTVTDYAGGNTIVFDAPGQRLVLPEASLTPGLPPDRVIGFGAGDSIDIDMPYGADETLSYDARTGRTVLTDTRSLVSETLFLPRDLSGLSLSADRGLPNGDTGTLLTLGGAGVGSSGGVGSAPCFAAGTRVLTTEGYKPVEALEEGARLVTAAGRVRRLRWVGRREVACFAHPQPHEVWPVRVMAGAFAPGVPARDVVLSPDHAVFVGGGLVPVRELLNGASIVREQLAAVRYFHLELARHDVLLAEGLAVESYLDTGNRHHFANGGTVVSLHPAFGRRSGAACAPALDAAGIAAVRAWLRARAGELGFVRETAADVHLLADGVRVDGVLRDGVWRGVVRAGVRRICVVSRAAAAADGPEASDDRRLLGVALRGFALSGLTARRVGPEDAGWGPGFYAPERDAGGCWRWSDGRGWIDPAVWRGLGNFRLDLHVQASVLYWRQAALNPARGGGICC